MTHNVYLDDLPASDVRVGYGEIGRHGRLGYEDKSVFINGPGSHQLCALQTLR